MKTIGQQTKIRDFPFQTEKSGIDPSRREELIEKHAHMIYSIASRIFSNLSGNMELNDLINAGTIGFIDALNKYDPGKNIEFKTYAEYRIRGAIIDELRSMDWIPRSVRKKAHTLEEAFHFLEQKYGRSVEDEEVARFLNLDMDSYYTLLTEAKGVSLLNIEDLGVEIEAPENLLGFDKNPYLHFSLKEMNNFITSAIQELPEKERLVVTLYYYEELNMKEIASVLGLTESRISQLHTKAVIRLKKKLKKY
ncbi:MAG: FliA/WhiG family RNA polymerase sigma factor [Deltaproteobacteria bacterium]|nr:FliA/WhiG family RNA polymerase sigma factor [Deltaproteobacteria bacterium]